MSVFRKSGSYIPKTQKGVVKERLRSKCLLLCKDAAELADGIRKLAAEDENVKEVWIDLLLIAWDADKLVSSPEPYHFRLAQYNTLKTLLKRRGKLAALFRD